MIFNLIPLTLGSMLLASPLAYASPLVSRDISVISKQLGIPAPDFHNEAAIWSTSFTKEDSTGAKYNVQLPRVYNGGKYDAASSEQHFLNYFTAGNEAWKEGAWAMSNEKHVEARFSAQLTLKYCNRGHGTGACTGFSLGYNSGGCQAAPGTQSIVITYSNNGAVVVWNRKGCSGSHTFLGNGCNAGNENIDDETPGTNSFQFIVGCSF